ncbi:MAG: hypothetical protein ACP5N2_02500 [Candidatus Nanoarchaeia archaeon]
MNKQNKIEIYCLLKENLATTFEIKNPELLSERERDLELEINSFEEKSPEECKAELTDYINNNLATIGLTSKLDKLYDTSYSGPDKESIEDIKSYAKWETQKMEDCTFLSLIKLKKSNTNAGFLVRMSYFTAAATQAFFPLIINPILTESAKSENIDWKSGTVSACLFAGVGIYSQISGYIQGKKKSKALNEIINNYDFIVDKINQANVRMNIIPEATQIHAKVKETNELNFVTLEYKPINNTLKQAYLSQ